ncbi:MAG: efflux RND transporter permease subunit [Porticoccaceae bacterium]|nr:efflux RND transporter permease subunit [Porticoccaceae bacterium]MDG1475423.1 efflux RND transporter permease subunit [Porticoccaceae bacterium]
MNASIRWFVNNPVAANLLMFLIIIGGAFGAFGIGKEVFPATSINYITVNMSYPGAGPKEVEEQIVVRIEEAIYNLEGIKGLSSEARKGRGSVTAEIDTNYDMTKMLNDIKSRVDAVITFPLDAERPIVTEVIERQEVIRVALFGDADERVLKEYGERIRDDLASTRGVDFVEIWGARQPQVDIELSELAMRRYGISFDDVVSAVRRTSLNLPAGTIRAESGDIQVQTRGQAYYESDFKKISVSSRNDGTQVTIGDVAEVKDTFEERNALTRFNGKKAIFLAISVGESPDVMKTTKAVKDYVANGASFLPDELQMDTWRDYSILFEGRLSLLSKNALGGLVLVFIILMLFLSPQLAFWVALGIGVAYMGALWILPSIGLTLNMLSMFAFLLILGIIVDDAIIVGESVFRHQEEGLDPLIAAREGAQAVSKPVFLAVLSTMIFFSPIFFLPGLWSNFLWAIPAITLVALSFSLIESLWILPSHLAQMKATQKPKSILGVRLLKVRLWCANGLTWVAKNKFKPILQQALKWHNLTMVLFFLALTLSLTLVGAGYVRQVQMPNVASDFISMRLEMPDGHSKEAKLDIMKRAENAARILSSDSEIQEYVVVDKLIANQLSFMWGDTIRLLIELSPEVTGKIDPKIVGERWQANMGPIPAAKKVSVDSTLGPPASMFSIALTSANVEQLALASAFIKEELGRLPGTKNIRDNLHSGRQDIDVKLLPNADGLGISLSQVASKVRQGFYGAEAQRIPRDRDDVRVMVRYPKDARSQVDTLDSMRIRTANGSEVPFYSVAEATYVPGYSRIQRTDRERSIRITALPSTGQLTVTEIASVIYGDVAKEMSELFPEVSVKKDGQLEDQEEFNTSALQLFGLAILLIYSLMAIEFKSYLKPFGVLSAIPFGVMGAIFGHLMMGLDFSLLSIVGVLAVSGVVVNDNLVLIDRIIQLREEGEALYESLVRASVERFRPIILTSITTFIGLAPILVETSVQAQFLIPMVASLAFGVLFATAVTLLFVPCLYMSGARLKQQLIGV